MGGTTESPIRVCNVSRVADTAAYALVRGTGDSTELMAKAEVKLVWLKRALSSALEAIGECPVGLSPSNAAALVRELEKALFEVKVADGSAGRVPPDPPADVSPSDLVLQRPAKARKVVTAKRFPAGAYVLNVDGAARNNPGPGGSGGWLRHLQTGTDARASYASPWHRTRAQVRPVSRPRGDEQRGRVPGSARRTRARQDPRSD
jgi:hypothetical protein